MRNKLIENAGKYGRWIALFLLLYFPIFLNLDVLPIRIWDESQNAMNAYEMLGNGHWLVPTYHGEPEMFSLKPSLAPFLQMLCMKVLGAGELGIRLPSALAAVFTCLMMLFVSLRLLKNFWLGFSACLVLVTIPGYIQDHVSRTGDSDSLLIFFNTVYALSFFMACERKNETGIKNGWLHLFFISLILASLTKGIAAFLFLPGLLVYAVGSRSQVWLLKSRYTYIYAFLLVGLNVAYYWWREVHSPGYLGEVIDRDLFGRFSRVIDERSGGFWYYLDLFHRVQLSPWIYLLPVALLAGLFLYEGARRRLLVYCTTLFVLHYVVIGTAQSKADWYPAPEFPFMALIIALFITWLHEVISKAGEQNTNRQSPYLPFLFLMMVFQQPYRTIVEKVYDKRENYWDPSQMDISHFLKGALRHERNISGYKCFAIDYTRPVDFYVDLLKDRGVNFSYAYTNNIFPGDRVITYQKVCVEELMKKFDVVQIEQFKNTVKIYRILRKLEPRKITPSREHPDSP